MNFRGDEGYTFEGWFYDITFTKPVTTISGRKGNLNVFAKWKKNLIPITDAEITIDTNYMFSYDGVEKRPPITVELNGDVLL